MLVWSSDPDFGEPKVEINDARGPEVPEETCGTESTLLAGSGRG